MIIIALICLVCFIVLAYGVLAPETKKVEYELIALREIKSFDGTTLIYTDSCYTEKTRILECNEKISFWNEDVYGVKFYKIVTA